MRDEDIRYIHELEQQNKRYREAIDKIHDAQDMEEIWDIVDECKGLEGDPHESS